MKVWVIVYVCRGTKTVKLLPTASYNTRSFLLTHEQFIAAHREPLVAAGYDVTKDTRDKNKKKDWTWKDVFSKFNKTM